MLSFETFSNYLLHTGHWIMTLLPVLGLCHVHKFESHLFTTRLLLLNEYLKKSFYVLLSLCYD